MQETTTSLTTDELLKALAESPPHTNYCTFVDLPMLGRVLVATCMCDCHRDEHGVVFEAVMTSDMGQIPDHASTPTGFLLLLGRMGVGYDARWQPIERVAR